MEEEEAIQKLKETLEEVKQLKYKDSGTLDRLKRRTEMILKLAFGEKTSYINDLAEIKFYSIMTWSGMPEKYDIEAWERGKGKIVNLITTAIEEKELSKEKPILGDLSDFWVLIHPSIVKVAKRRFDAGQPDQRADAVEAAFKEINERVKGYVKSKTGEERDGASLMNYAFSLDRSIIIVDDLSTGSGKNRQVGYMQIFAGAMTAIRNPKAHKNIELDENRTIHFLFLASLLMQILDESGIPK